MNNAMVFSIIKGKHRRHEITAEQVWEYADEGKITDLQAMNICGPRPKAAEGGGAE